MGNICCNNNPKINENKIIKIEDNICNLVDNFKFEDMKNFLGNSLNVIVYEGDKNNINQNLKAERNETKKLSKGQTAFDLRMKNNIETKQTINNSNDIKTRRKSVAISMNNPFKNKFLYQKKITNHEYDKFSDFHQHFKLYQVPPNQSIKNLLKIDIKSKSNQELKYIKFNDLKDKDLLESTENTVQKLNSDNKDISSQQKNIKEKKKRLPVEIINKEITSKQKEILMKVLIENELLYSDMPESFVNMILNTLIYKRFKDGVILFNENSGCEDYYYIIEKGKIEYGIDDDIYELPKLNGIGTQVLLKYSKKKCYIKSIGRTYLFELSLEKYRKFMNEYERKKIEEKYYALRKHIFFSFFDESYLIELIKVCPTKKILKDNIILKVDTCFENIYYILSGEIQVKRNDIVVKVLSEGEIFGEIGLFNPVESFYEYCVYSDCSVIEISYENIFLFLGDQCIKTLVQELFKNAIKNEEYLSFCFTNKIIKKIYGLFQLKFYFNDTILSKNQKKIILPISGIIIKSKNTAIDTNNIVEIMEKNYKKRLILGKIDIESVTTDVNIMYNLIGDEVIVFECDWYELFPKIITNEIFKIYRIRALEFAQTLRKLPYFKYISSFKMYQIINSFKEERVKAGQIILKDGPKSEQFYYIFNGEVNLNINNVVLKTLKNGMSFGDISDIINYTQTTNFISKKQVILFVLDKDNYDDIVNKSDFYLRLRKIIDKNDSSITLNNLYYLTDLGSGSFGKVYLVHNNEKLFALKTTEITAISENKEKATLIINEKIIMTQVDHPFIVRLFNTFKTRDYIFFLIEFVNGINMREFLELKDKRHLRNLEEAKFFGSILFSVLHYLSKRRIIHRDLKPDNLMLEKNGYIKVIDFGVAKYLKGKDYTITVTGTPHYMSPEVILSKPYSFEVDYWSVGIILYEFFYGRVPFGYGTNSINEIYKEIIEGNLHLPSDPKNENFNNLIKALLYKVPSNRISVFKLIKNHIFFKDFDFDSLLNYSYNAPYKPVKNNIIENENELINNVSIPFLSFMQNNILQSISDIDENFLKTSGERFDNF